jgi:hypothetical protein
LSQQSAARAGMTPDHFMNGRNGRSADVPVGTADEKANESANEKAMNDPTSKSHSYSEDANEDVGVPGGNEDVGVPGGATPGGGSHETKVTIDTVEAIR